MRNYEDNLIVKKTFEFSIIIIKFSDELKEYRKFEMASQLFRSGTSIGANAWEAQNAESNKDFIHKFKISAKEADETEYWLRLARASETYPNPSEELFQELESIVKIISKIVGSSKRRL